MSRGLLLVVALVHVFGCTAVVDVGRYTFDDDPCPRIDTCAATARSYNYLTADLDITRPVDGRIDGFNFDGTDDSVCGRIDAISPTGETGIDNQVGGIELFENPDMPIGATTRARILDGDTRLQILTVANIDDLTNDDCVTVYSRTGYVPQPYTVREYLDQDDDDYVDAREDMVMDYGSITWEDPSACIVDGRLHTRILRETTIEIGPTLLIVDRVRVRSGISEDALSDGLFGGSVSVDDLSRAVMDSGLVEVDPTAFLEAVSDLDPDGAQCDSISWALRFSSVGVTLGEIRR